MRRNYRSCENKVSNWINHTIWGVKPPGMCLRGPTSPLPVQMQTSYPCDLDLQNGLRYCTAYFKTCWAVLSIQFGHFPDGHSPAREEDASCPVTDLIRDIANLSPILSRYLIKKRPTGCIIFVSLLSFFLFLREASILCSTRLVNLGLYKKTQITAYPSLPATFFLRKFQILSGLIIWRNLMHAALANVSYVVNKKIETLPCPGWRDFFAHCDKLSEHYYFRWVCRMFLAC